MSLAILLVHPVGRRLPAFAVAFPAWVATALPMRVAVGFILGGPSQVLTGGGNPFENDVLDGWVFLGWVGTSVVFAAGLSETLKAVAIPDGGFGATSGSPGQATLELFVLLAALGGAIGGALRLVEEERGNRALPVAATRAPEELAAD